MDSEVSKLIAQAEENQNVNNLKQAFRILNPESHNDDNNKNSGNAENLSQNLYVLCAETAIHLNEFEIANKSIQTYFNLPMISNQFVARAYLCQFQLLVPKETNELENLDKSIPFLLKAIDFSKQNKRYHFIVYNASLIYWKYARNFLKNKFKRYLCPSLQSIVSSLNEIDDSDYEWRAILSKTLIECYLDDNNRDKAQTLTVQLEKFIKNHVPNMHIEFFTFSVKNSLFNEEDLKNIINDKIHLNAIYKIETLRLQSTQRKNNDKSFDEQLHDLYKYLVPQNKFGQSPVNVKSDKIDNDVRIKLLLKLAHICILFDNSNTCSMIIGYVKERNITNEEVLYEIELIESELLVRELKHKQEKYSKEIVKVRLEAIRRCDEILKNIIRLDNFDLIEFGCTVQWNLCLPLLQPGLRKEIRRQIEFLGECLEKIDSLDWSLRCQIHFEISKCLVELEQLQQAEQHLIKALKLDDYKLYTDQIKFALNRLQIRAELYKTPHKVEDQAAMIIEQSVKIEKSSKKAQNSEINTRSLLLRAADLLAHNEFSHVMESETYKQSVGKMNEDQVSRIVAKARNYLNCVSKCASHLKNRLKDLENENYGKSSSEIEEILRADFKVRLKLWFDLSRLSRKQQIWDVCRVSSRFCLLYDNETFLNRFLPLNEPDSMLFNKELLRNLAEAHFIKGESLVQYLRGENIELLSQPIPPMLNTNENDSQKRVVERNFDNDPEWNEYCAWIKSLSSEIIEDFMRGIKIGTILNESWLVCQGATYCWNYLHHLFENRKYNEINSLFTEILEALKKVGHGNEAQLLVNICNALSIGLMAPYLPSEQHMSSSVSVSGKGEDGDKSVNKSKKTSDVEKKSIIGGGKGFSIPAEAQADFKRALEVCEYALQITNGDNLSDVVFLKDRLPLLKSWVLAKQMLQSPIKNFGLQSSSTARVQDKYTKCLVAVEILDRNTLGLIEIKEAPSIKDTIELVDQASTWPDRLIELQLWCRLAILSNKAFETENLRYAHSKALQTISYFEKKKSENKQIYLTSQSLLSETCIALGEHLASLINGSGKVVVGKQQRDAGSSGSMTKEGKNNLRREALHALADGAGYAAKAENYDLAVHAARQFWNFALPYLKKPLERALLLENVNEIISSLNSTYKLRHKDDIENIEDIKSDLVKINKKDKQAKPEVHNVSVVTTAEIVKLEDASDDLTLRAALYGCLFQILIDKHSYEEALQEMDHALQEMPRSRHRLLIYRYRIMTKAKLGLDVSMDLQKFKEESERNLAQMYRRVALSSTKKDDFIQAYQNAIEALTLNESLWMKFEYLVELSQWLYSNEYKLQNCIDLIEWAIEVVSNVKRDKLVSAQSNTSKSSKLTKKTSNKQLLTNELNTASVISEIHSDLGTDLDGRHSNLLSKDTFIMPKSFDINDFNDISQLDCLIRANVILAQMVGRSHQEYSNYLIKSYSLVVRLIELSIENANSALKDKQKADGQNESQNLGKKGAQTASTNKKLNEQSQSKQGMNKKQGKTYSSGSVIPKTFEEWSQFEVNDDLVSVWTHDIMRKNGLNTNTIKEPFLLFHFLDLLGEMINELGYTHLLFPIYSMQIMLARSALIQKFSSSQESLKLTSTLAYIRLKLMILCVELNLVNSVAHHQQVLVNHLYENQLQSENFHPGLLLKLVQLDPSEVSLVRDEIYSYNQRKIQAAKDEANLLLSKKGKNDAKPSKRQTFAQNSLNSLGESDSKKDMKYKKPIGELNFIGEQKNVPQHAYELLVKDIWIKIAQCLIKIGFFQNSRDFLFESLSASNHLDDKYTQTKVNNMLGEISLFDSNFTEAIDYAVSAQKIPINEEFWFKNVILMIKATKNNTTEKNSIEKAVGIIHKSLEIIENECKAKRTNKTSKFIYMELMLKYELALINQDLLLKKAKSNKRQGTPSNFPDKINSLRPVVFKQLSQICQTYKYCIEKLIESGYKRDSIRVIRSYAELLRRFASDCFNIEAKHDYLSQTYDVLNHGIQILSEIWYDIQSLHTNDELHQLSLPVQRELYDLKLSLIDLSLEIFNIYLDEVRETNLNNLHKDYITKVYEDFIRTSNDLSESEYKWSSLIKRLPEEIISNLITCHSGCLKLKYLKSHVLYFMGRALRLISELKTELRSTSYKDNILITIPTLSKWDNKIIDAYSQIFNTQLNEPDHRLKSIKGSSMSIVQSGVEFEPVVEEREHEKTISEVSHETFTLDPLKQQEQDEVKDLFNKVNTYEAQSMECLLQALNLAYQTQDKQILVKISYELIEITGRLDLQLCSQFIALYQSCLQAIDMESLLESCLFNPKESLLAGYIHQMNYLKKNQIKTNVLSFPLIQQLSDAMRNKFNALKNLKISNNHLTLAKEFPNSYTFLILQHNQDKSELFATILDKLKVASVKNAKQTTNSPTKALVIKIKTDPQEFFKLQNQWRTWKADLESYNVKVEFYQTHELARKQSFGNMSSTESDEALLKQEELEQIEKDLEYRFGALVELTEEYLKPVTDYFQSYFNQTSQDSKNERPNEKIILLADLGLLEFPLESLKIFHDNQIANSLTRDFSLQIFYNRFINESEEDQSQSNEKEDKKQNNKNKTSNTRRQSAAPTQVTENVADNAIFMDPTRFSFMIDPYLEPSSWVSTQYHPVDTYKALSQAYPLVVPKWQGILGATSTSLGERERILTNSNGFLFYGMEKILSYYKVPKIVSSNLNTCQLLLSNDYVQTAKSINRTNKINVNKNQNELEFEKPLQASVLMSLAGVKCLVSNQWSLNLIESSNNIQVLLKELLSLPQSVGQVIRYKYSPHIKKMIEEKQKREELKRLETANKEKDKKDSKKMSKQKSPDRAKSTLKKNTESQIDINTSQSEPGKQESTDYAELAIIKKELFNTVCYGIPDIYFTR